MVEVVVGARGMNVTVSKEVDFCLRGGLFKVMVFVTDVTIGPAAAVEAMIVRHLSATVVE